MIIFFLFHSSNVFVFDLILLFEFSYSFFYLNRINSGRRSLVLVVFVGGVTFAEISALRYLSAQVTIFALSEVV